MSDPTAAILGMYREAAALYHRHEATLGAAALGYDIMYGPPTIEPPLLIVGFQPGGSQFEALPVLDNRDGSPPWPTVYEVGVTPAPFRLARSFSRRLIRTSCLAAPA